MTAHARALRVVLRREHVSYVTLFERLRRAHVTLPPPTDHMIQAGLRAWENYGQSPAGRPYRGAYTVSTDMLATALGVAPTDLVEPVGAWWALCDGAAAAYVRCNAQSRLGACRASASRRRDGDPNHVFAHAVEFSADGQIAWEEELRR